MKAVKLIRYEFSDEGTFGVLVFGDKICHCIELPDRGNQQTVSCIPPGNYECQITQSPSFGRVYHVLDVPDRSHILFHAGNYAGDIEEDLKTDSYGCILPGLSRGVLSGQKVVLNSRRALKFFMRELKEENFELQIIEL